MKKIIVLLGFGMAFVFALSTFNIVETYAQEEDVKLETCGGIQGLVCPSGSPCVYEDGSKTAPYPDAVGKCTFYGFGCAGKTDGTICTGCEPCPPGKMCPKKCVKTEGTCQANVCTFTPTATPKPAPPWSIAPVTPGTAELCESLIISDKNLGAGESLTVTAKSTSNDIIAFGWWLYNMDNLTAGNDPKPIRFVSAGTEVAGVVKNKQVAVNEATLTIDFADIDRQDFNWTYYMPKPKRIKVDAYFKKAGTTDWSKYKAACSKTFNAATVDPTPTPVSTCVCGAANACAASCFFDKFAAGVTYTDPVKCNLGAGLFSSAPTDANKNKWCRNYLRTKGDSNGDGKVGILDYFYYVSATVFGAKLPPTANIDFNGDGVVSSADKTILMKSLKP